MILGLFALLWGSAPTQAGLRNGLAQLGHPLVRALNDVFSTQITTVTVKGNEVLAEEEVVALLGPLDSAPWIDVDILRTRLEAYPRIASATVRLTLPGRLDIQVDERRPFALWQNERAFYPIDVSGALIDDQERILDGLLPLVVGAGAPGHAAEFLAMSPQRGSASGAGISVCPTILKSCCQSTVRRSRLIISLCSWSKIIFVASIHRVLTFALPTDFSSRRVWRKLRR